MKLLHNSLRLNLVLGFALSCLVGLLVFGGLAQNIAVASFHKIVHQNLVDGYAEGALRHYQARGSWEGIDPPEPPRATPEARPQNGRPAGLGPGVRPKKHLGIVAPDGTVVTRMEGLQIGEKVDLSQIPFQKTLTWNGQVIGTVIEEVVPEMQSWSRDEQAMVKTINQTLVLAGSIGLVLAVLLGWLMARQLISPLEGLTRATRNLKLGQDPEPVPVVRPDEVGVLTRAFNQMSKSLAAAEKQRRQMIADIAHDLGTPLTVASGYVQGMHQGKLQATPERLQVVHEELLLLQNLVDDLRLLSLADAGKLTLSLDLEHPERLMGSIQKAFQFRAEKQQVRLLLEVEEGLPPIQMDFERMRQVLGNLVNNALHYTPAGGEVRLLARQATGGVLLQVQDSGVGIASDKLPYIFDRFYRVDETRSPENGGGSGLGLAIARSIVELHGGKISASSVVQEGTTISILAPV